MYIAINSRRPNENQFHETIIRLKIQTIDIKFSKDNHTSSVRFLAFISLGFDKIYSAPASVNWFNQYDVATQKLRASSESCGGKSDACKETKNENFNQIQYVAGLCMPFTGLAISQ